MICEIQVLMLLATDSTSCDEHINININIVDGNKLNNDLSETNDLI